ncbi:hypothetical protein M9Y10_021788 [Tritrichomonas musculus]|uniref:60S ribosomal export protein NMD3 n=1 Tax=Tritrichomonas musculus TaxID=1915356 RepID=A0ABR2KRC8_9EUKA
MEEFTSTIAQIPCCVCGVKIDPNPSNMCIDCLRRQEDFGDKIQTLSSLNYCSSCGRYQSTPTSWINAELDSPDLLHLCLKRINGLKEFKLIDAKFLWTEPHSKRIKVSITIEKETFNGTILRRSMIIVFKIRNLQCPDCCEAATPRDHWKAIVQLRQHSKENRTIYWLEQQILSHEAHSLATAIERKQEGIDFQFNDKPAAERFVNFVKNFSPIEIKTSNRLAGQDLQCNTFDLRFTFSLKCPSCSRQDLIVVPNHIFEMTGCKSRLMICYSLGKYVTLIDPFSANFVRIDAKQYWSKPFDPIMTHKQLKRFTIISKEIIGNAGSITNRNTNKNGNNKGNKNSKESKNKNQTKTNQQNEKGDTEREDNFKPTNKKSNKRANRKAIKKANRSFNETQNKTANDKNTPEENQTTNDNDEKELAENQNHDQIPIENQLTQNNENESNNDPISENDQHNTNESTNQEIIETTTTTYPDADADNSEIPDQLPLQRFQIAELELTDEETYSDRVLVRTHLGYLLNEGDVCLGYDLREAVFTDEISDSLKKTEFLSGVVIVARGSSSLKKKRKKKPRKFTLKKLAPVADEEGFEAFMDELEQDAELRNGVNLYKNNNRNETETDDENADEIDGVLAIIDL